MAKGARTCLLQEIIEIVLSLNLAFTSIEWKEWYPLDRFPTRNEPLASRNEQAWTIRRPQLHFLRQSSLSTALESPRRSSSIPPSPETLSDIDIQYPNTLIIPSYSSSSDRDAQYPDTFIYDQVPVTINYQKKTQLLVEEEDSRGYALCIIYFTPFRTASQPAAVRLSCGSFAYLWYVSQ